MVSDCLRDKKGRFIKGHCLHKNVFKNRKLDLCFCGTPFYYYNFFSSKFNRMKRTKTYCSRQCSQKYFTSWNKGKTAETDIRIKNHTDKLIGRKLDKKSIEKRTLNRRKNDGYAAWNKGKNLKDYYGLEKFNKLTKEHSNKMKILTKKRIENMSLEQKEAWLKNLHAANSIARPSCLDRKMIDIILELNLPYTFVGDGKVWIHGKNPDFINNNGQKKIIEVFGNYWHSIGAPRYSYAVSEEGRKEIFSQYGFKTLVVWENEFKDKAKLVEKVLNFEKA